MIKDILKLSTNFTSNFDITNQKNKYLSLSKNLPEFLINKSSLSKNEVIEIIKNKNHDNKTELLSILFWGIYFEVITKKKDIISIIKFIESDSFEKKMSDIKNTIIDSKSPSQLFKKFERELKIPGLGYSYFTKLFFFYREAYGKTTYPILDKWLSNAWCAIDGATNKNTEVYNKFYKGASKPKFDGALKRSKDKAYGIYVKFMEETAKREDITIVHLEEKLFGAHLSKYPINNPRTIYRDWALKNNIPLNIAKKTTEQKAKGSTKNKRLKTKTTNKPPFYLHSTNNYKAIRFNKESSQKIGYIKSNGYLHASEELKNLLDYKNLYWEDASRDGGSREKWKYKFLSEKDCITLLIDEGILKK